MFSPFLVLIRARAPQNNTNQVSISSESGASNFWDNGTIGNYWSDYQTKYPNANEIDNSGIGNTPYVIDANNIDHYPLLKPSVIPEFRSLLIIMPLLLSVLFVAVALMHRKASQESLT